MKILSTIADWLQHAEFDGSRPAPQWCRDPLLHPQLRDMSERELADLPFSSLTEDGPAAYGNRAQAGSDSGRTRR